MNISNYNWKIWTEQSDAKYHALRNKKNRNFNELKDHNLVFNCHQELEVLLKIACAKWGPITHNKALDICCGAGFVTSCLADFGFEAIGIDINEDAIGMARELHPNCQFYCVDATIPQSLNFGTTFDLILVREAHPFSRVDNIEFQLKTINNFLSLLNQNGILIIAHARHGGGMEYPSINFNKLKYEMKKNGVEFSGPYFISLLKRLALNEPSLFIVSILSIITAVIARAKNARLIEAFFIHKIQKSAFDVCKVEDLYGGNHNRVK